MPRATPKPAGPPFLRAVAGTAGVTVSGNAIAALTNILLARNLGVSEYGAFAYTVTWVGVLCVVGLFGLESMLVRDIANYRMRTDWPKLLGLIRWSRIVTFAIPAAIALVANLALRGIKPSSGIDLAPILLPAGVFLILTVTMRALGASLRGLHWVVIGQAGESLIIPAVVCVLVIALGTVYGRKLDAPSAVGIYACATAVACVFLALQLRRALVCEVPRGSGRAYESRRWLVDASPLLFLGVLGVLNNQISSLALGTWSGTSALGLYTAADRLAQIVALPLAAVNLTLAPTFANLYQAGKLAGLQELVTRSARLMTAGSAVVAVTLIVGGKWFLLLFGREFTAGHLPLALLCAGQLINAAIGSVGNLLVMTGHGRDAALGVGIGVLANVALSAVLIPRFGAVGAAIATATSLTVWNIVLACFVWKRIGIATTAISRWRYAPAFKRRRG